MTFSVDVTQKLVVMQEHGTNRMTQYILTLIPDKHY